MKKIIEKIKSLFEDKKKRYLYVFLFCLPFIIAIAVFGIVTYKEGMSIISLITNGGIKEEYQINNENYVLRDNATDYQMDLFTELKEMLEGKKEHTSRNVVESICKNHVADFYTWTNKVGQYDVGGLYYVYEPLRNNIYIKARDEFYQYINEYIDKYGAKNLLEVEHVDAESKTYSGEYVALLEDMSTMAFDEVYVVTCKWTYKDNSKFSPAKYAIKMNYIVVNNNGRFDIVEAYE